MFDGSVIATISVEPARLTGMSWWAWRSSAGTSWMTSGEISKSARLIDGTPYCFERKLVSSVFVEDAELGEAVAEACTGLALLFLRLLQLRERDQVLADQQLSQSTHSRSLDARYVHRS